MALRAHRPLIALALAALCAGAAGNAAGADVADDGAGSAGEQALIIAGEEGSEAGGMEALIILEEESADTEAGSIIILDDAPAAAAPVPRRRHWGTYTSEAQARAAVRALDQADTPAIVEPVRPQMPVQRAELTGYDTRAEAEAVARELRVNGIEADVETAEGGFRVIAGTFARPENFLRRYRQLRELGYPNVEAGELWIEVERYNVVSFVDENGVLFAPTERSAAEQEALVLLDEDAGADQADLLVLGETPRERPVAESVFAAAEHALFDFALEEFFSEVGWLTNKPDAGDVTGYVRTKAHLSMNLSPALEIFAQARLDASAQTRFESFGNSQLEPDQVYLRYRGEQWRVTAGNQLVLWGRLDGESPIDKTSALDVARLFEDTIDDRRRAAPAIRYERFLGEWKIDALVQPLFRGAEMPARSSIWSPLDLRRGRALGLAFDPVLAELVRFGGFDDDEDGFGSAGVRITRAARGIDYGFTVQNFRHSAPTFSLSDAIQRALLGQFLATGTVDPRAAIAAAPGPAFEGEHPRSWLIGADLSYPVGAHVIRAEAALMDDVPVYPEGSLAAEEVAGMDWGLGWESYPGEGNTRLIVQLTGRFLFSDRDLRESKTAAFLNGQVETTFAEDKWRARLNYNVRLDRSDWYVNPEIAYIGFQNRELYLGVRVFDGDERTIGGFYDRNDHLAAGWRITF